jgi:uncharacterized membrane protein YedE/YeeE
MAAAWSQTSAFITISGIGGDTTSHHYNGGSGGIPSAFITIQTTYFVHIMATYLQLVTLDCCSHRILSDPTVRAMTRKGKLLMLNLKSATLNE